MWAGQAKWVKIGFFQKQGSFYKKHDFEPFSKIVLFTIFCLKICHFFNFFLRFLIFSFGISIWEAFFIDFFKKSEKNCKISFLLKNEKKGEKVPLFPISRLHDRPNLLLYRLTRWCLFSEIFAFFTVFSDFSLFFFIISKGTVPPAPFY